MVGRGHDYVRVRRESHAFGLGIGWRAHHHGQIGQVVAELSEQFGAVVHGQVELDAGMAAREFDHQAREKIIAGADHGDVQLAAGDAAELRQRFLGFLELLDDGAAVVEQLGAARRQIHLLAELLEQHQPHVAFQRFHLRRYGRLGQVQFLGRAGVAEVAGHGFEHFQLAQGGMLHG